MLPPKGSIAASEPPMEMPTAIWGVLQARGLTDATDIDRILHPRLRDLAHPFSLDHMDRAIQRLVEAARNDEPILIYGDYDLDGTPGVALLREGFAKLGFTRIFTFQPSRMNDGYGLHARHVLRFSEQGVRLVVTVDVGITDNDAVDELQSAGVEVIVTDHHLPKETLPNALAVVNPNKGTCGSRLQHLCGTGVAFYLVLALRMELERLGLLKLKFDPKDLLDLFALATITDMVPLVHENRVLTKHGLKTLARTTRPGLRLLLGELGLYGREITAQDVGFRVAPKLNALTRLEDGVTAYEVLTADERNARALVDQALHVNDKRQSLQSHAHRIASAWIDENFDCDRDQAIFVYSREFHPGIISLVASDLASTYRVPAFVGAVRDEANGRDGHDEFGGRVLGSARAPSGDGVSDIDLQDILSQVSHLLTRFGGHRHAAGFETRLKNVEELREAFNIAAARTVTAKQINVAAEQANATANSLAAKCDAELRLSDLSHLFMSWYDALGPFGPGFEPPIFLMRGLRVRSVRKLKNKYLRYTLTDGLRDLEAPWFHNPVEFQKGERIDFIFEPQWNDYNGRRTLQARILAAQARP